MKSPGKLMNCPGNVLEKSFKNAFKIPYEPCFSQKFGGKEELILTYYRTEPKKFAVAENFYPKKWEVLVANFRQKGFQVKFETLNMACILLYTKMTSTPPPPGLVTSRINT